MTPLTRHLREIDESYWQHMAHALGFAGAMILGGLACLIHAIFPFLFVRTGSDCIDSLHRRMVVNRSRLTPRHKRPSARYSAKGQRMAGPGMPGQ